MKTKILVLLVSFLLTTNAIFSQEKTKKQLKEESKIEKQKQTKILVDSKMFVFVARRASPQGGKTVDLTTNPNYVAFQPEFIKSEMPFFGTAYNPVYGGSAGLDFEGKPVKFTVEKEKKAYEIRAVVKGENDEYSLLLTVYFEGGASLLIKCGRRSTISYSGEISAPIKKK